MFILNMLINMQLQSMQTPEYAVLANLVCFRSKMEHVLPGVTVLRCRYIGAIFIMVPLCVMATTLVY